MLRRLPILLAATVLVALAPAAGAAAQGVGNVGLSPNTVSSASTAQIAIAGVTGFTTLPTGVELLLQPGFTSSVNAVTTLCTGTAQTTGNCPPASQIGTGNVQVSFLGTPVSVPVTLFLGPPQQSGDISSVILVGNVDGTSLNVSGRIFTPPGGGLEVLLASFPPTALTLSSIAVSLSASQSHVEHITKIVKHTVIKTVWVGKGKHRHKKKVKHVIRRTVHKTITVVDSIVTNPPTCSGTWTGSAILTFASGTDTVPLSTACTT